MKKGIAKSLITILIAGAMFFSFVACNSDQPPKVTIDNSTQEKTEAASPESTKLEKVSLNFLSMGDSPSDYDFVISKINEKLMADLNCELKLTFLTWSDWQNKYNLMLASGEQMDAAYGASWLNYSQNAKKGAFLALDDLLAKAAPKLLQEVNSSKWEGVKVDRKIYGVPRIDVNFVQRGLIYREDLRQKYSLPEIKDLETLEAYYAAIKQNEPGMIPLVDPTLMAEVLPYVANVMWVDGQDPLGATHGMLVADPKNPSQIKSIFELPEYKTLLSTMKRWADKGYLPKDALSSSTSTANQSDDLKAGKVASANQQNPDALPGTASAFAKDHPDFKVGYFFYPDMNGQILPSLPAQDVTVILKRSANPERALMVIEKFLTDKDYWSLQVYGIKGRNYNVTPEGTLDMSAVTTDKEWNIGLWGWLNADWSFKPQIDGGQGVLLERLRKAAVDNPFAGFTVDLSSVQAESAAVLQVYNQFAVPLQAGFTKDIDASYNEMMSRFKAAGFDKFKEEIQRQLTEWLATK